MANSTTFLFSTGKTPGNPAQTGQVLLLGSRPNLVEQPQKIFDSSVAAIGMLYARKQGKFRPYHDRVYERFWKRELDIEDKQTIAAVLAEVGADPEGFFAYLEREGWAELDAIQQQADADEIFGVPIFIVEGEMFWGHDRVPLLEERLEEKGLRK